MSAVILVWNIWLTSRLLETNEEVPAEPVADEPVVIESRITDFTTEITETVSRCQSRIVTVTSAGGGNEHTASGVIYAKDADNVYIFTVSGILDNSEETVVTFDNGVSVSADIVGIDHASGVGLLRTVPSFETTTLVISDSELLGQGENIIAMGGRRPETSSSMISIGVVSRPGERRVSSGSFWLTNIIESDAVINRENYGGPLLNVGGELVGILIERPYNGEERMAYAVTTSELKYIYTELLSAGEVTKGSLGTTVRNISEMRAYEKSAHNISLDRVSGVLVTNVLTDSPADGLILPGDVLTAMDGARVTDKTELRRKLYDHVPEDEVVLTIIREGQEIQVSVVLS